MWEMLLFATRQENRVRHILVCICARLFKFLVIWDFTGRLNCHDQATGETHRTGDDGNKNTSESSSVRAGGHASARLWHGETDNVCD